MAMPRRAVLICVLGIAVLYVGVASRLLFRRELQSLDMRSPKPPGPPIFAGNRTSGGRLLHFVKPEYPPELRDLGYQTVRLRCRVLEDGTVSEISHDGGPVDLFPYAKAAVERWRYEPLRQYDPFTGRSEAITKIDSIQVPFYGTWP